MARKTKPLVPLYHAAGWCNHGAWMTSSARDRPNRWPQGPVWWIGGVTILGLMAVGAFSVRSLIASGDERIASSSEGTALATQAEAERAGVEGDESPGDGANGTAAEERSDEGIDEPPGPPEETTESNSSASSEAGKAGEQPAPVTTTTELIDAVADEAGDDTEGVGERLDSVVITAELSDPVPVAEDEDNEIEVGIGSPMSWATGAGWIVPWGDGILEVGWLKIGEEPNGNGIYDETRLVARTLVDSQTCQSIQPLSEATDLPECWEDLGEYQSLYEGGRISAIISDGRRLLVASEADDQIYVSVTNDLDSWDTTEIELPRPSGLPDFVYASSYVDHLAVNPNGWLAKITTEVSIDVLALAGIREPKTKIRSVYELGDDVHIPVEFVLFEGLFVEWWLDDERRYREKQFFSWDNLGISHSMFCHYSYYCSMKHYIHSSNVSGSVWSALWGEEPVRVELPMGFGVGGRCCAIVGTSAGYMAFSDPSEGGYDPTWFGSANAFFSSDGIRWDLIDSPSGVFLDLWTTRDGVVASNVPSRGDDELPGSNWDTIYWWFADSDGSNWREIEEPLKPPMLAPFQYPTIRLATG